MCLLLPRTMTMGSVAKRELALGDFALVKCVIRCRAGDAFVFFRGGVAVLRYRGQKRS